MRDCTIAGSPLKRAMLDELRRLAAEAGDDVTPDDIVLARVAGGETLIQIAKTLAEATDLPVSASILSAWLRADPARKAALAQARKDSAPLLVEQAVEILEVMPEDRDAINKGKAQADLRTWLASKYDRATFGNDAAQVNVQLNMGQLHLDALRRRAVPAMVTAPALPAGPDYEVICACKGGDPRDIRECCRTGC